MKIDEEYPGITPTRNTAFGLLEFEFEIFDRRLISPVYFAVLVLRDVAQQHFGAQRSVFAPPLIEIVRNKAEVRGDLRGWRQF